jgi:uncharacterized GH25 family protein
MDNKKTVTQRAVKRRSSGRTSRLVAILVGVAILIEISSSPSLKADDRKSEPVAADPQAATAPAPKTATFDLRIVDPDGKPIPDAKVNLSTQPPIDKVRLKAGKFLNKPRFGVNLMSDADGRVAVECPAHLDYLNFRIHKPGFGFYWSPQNPQGKPEALLAPVTVKLERAWTIGGLVVDADGKPVPNARVVLQIRWAGAGYVAPVDRLWTNSKGIWKFESVPQSMTQVKSEFSEPKYMTANSMLGRAEFEMKPGHEPTGKTTLKMGVTVTGKITDETGQPILKALVRTRVGQDTRNAFTDKKGMYRLEGCDPGNTRIVASAKGRAPELQQAEIAAEMKPVDFRLKPGNTLRVRILDEHGRPAPKATINIQDWRGGFDFFLFDQAPREADTDGVWEWHEAPAEEMTASISRPDGMTLNNRQLRAGKDEYIFRVPTALAITGKVVDSETKQPIKSFRIIRGSRYIDAQQIFWNTNNKVVGADGAYQIRETWEQFAFLVRIEADGYLHGVSREIKAAEGKVEVDFELVKGKDVAAAVLTPEGVPAAGAKVAVVAGDFVLVMNHGEIDNRAGRAEIQETDANGRFRIAAKNDDFSVVVTHQSGYAELTGLSNSNPRVIKLTPWARIEGVFQVAHKPLADVEVSLENAFVFARKAAPVDQDSRTTDLHGRFAFEQIAPGKRRISAKRTSGEGDSATTCSRTMVVDCPAGKTTQVEFASDGRPVIGQLQLPPVTKPDLQLSAAQIYVGRVARGQRVQSQLGFTATPDRNGNFSIDDLPPGDYFLSAFISGGRESYVRGHRFTVPKVNEKLSQRPVDLGVLTMERPSQFNGPKKAIAR